MSALRRIAAAALIMLGVAAGAAHAATPSITDRLSADKAIIEITGLPAGTEHIGVAVMQNPQGAGIKYLVVPPSQTVYTPPAGDPVVDVQAWSGCCKGTGQAIGGWAGRLQTIPGGEQPHEPPPPPLSEEPPVEPPHEEPASSFTPGIVQGVESLDWQADSILRPKIARIEFGLSEAHLHEHVAACVAALAKTGTVLQPLLGFAGRVPTIVESRAGAQATANVLGIQRIEFGNETSYGYQYGDGSSSASYKARARAIAVDVKEAAIVSKPYSVGILDQAEDGGSGTSVWVDEQFAAVPNLPEYVSGWVIHPYGTSGPAKLERMISQLARHGETSKPIDVTEFGIATDNGRTLTDNYGWPRNLTYSQAASLLPEAVGKLHTIAKGRLRSFELYQGRDQAVTATSTNREAYFGALQRNDTAKGPYTTAAQALLGS